jgi:selenocysteine-specific elongation factor
MIIATAGHVDHGKTLLVKALTGVDADRLPEEKQRGMTIDLGFAYMPAGGGATVGFVDVPGHERFVHNTLCGLASLDAVLLVVAADDGPKPQTIEHLAILDLLGIRTGALVITKIDRVAGTRVEEVIAEMKDLLRGTTLDGMSVFSLSAQTGEGVERLKQHLVAAARTMPAPSVRGNFRLAVDRCFTIAGAGLVVTGTVLSGSVSLGERVRALLAGGEARVRTIHAQNAQAPRAQVGERCALNLAGTDLRNHPIRRGDWIVGGTVPEAVRRFDALLRVQRTPAMPVEHWMPVHVHLAAADVTGRIAILEGEQSKGRHLDGGQSALVQIVLEHPIGAVFGDRFIVRDQSARHTLAGGVVVDIFPPLRGRAKPERIAEVSAARERDPAGALHGLLAQSPAGVDLERFAANRNLTPTEAEALYAEAGMKRVTSGRAARGWGAAHWERLQRLGREMVMGAQEAGNRLAPEQVLTTANLRLARPLALAIAEELVREGTLVRDGGGLRVPGHETTARISDAALWAKLETLLEAGGLRPPSAREMAEQVGQPLKAVEALLKEAVRLQLAVRVTPTRWYLPSAVTQLAELAEELGGQTERRVTAALFRDRSGLGRNLTIEVLEFFDRVKYTRRIGDAHLLLCKPADIPELSGRARAPGS